MYLRVRPFKDTKVFEEKRKAEETVEDTTKFVVMDTLAISVFQGNAVAAIQIQVKL